jgi:hypothetical protein
VDEYIDRSPTAPKREQERPADGEGDADFVVRQSCGLPCLQFCN